MERGEIFCKLNLSATTLSEMNVNFMFLSWIICFYHKFSAREQDISCPDICVRTCPYSLDSLFFIVCSLLFFYLAFLSAFVISMPIFPSFFFVEIEHTETVRNMFYWHRLFPEERMIRKEVFVLWFSFRVLKTFLVSVCQGQDIPLFLTSLFLCPSPLFVLILESCHRVELTPQWK